MSRSRKLVGPLIVVVPMAVALVASSVATAASPDPSPFAIKDGEPWIVYQWGTGTGDGLFLVRPDGQGQHALLPPQDGEMVHPDWSPDGTQIAFELVVGEQDVRGRGRDDGHERRSPAVPVDGDRPGQGSPGDEPSLGRAIRAASRPLPGRWPRPDQYRCRSEP